MRNDGLRASSVVLSLIVGGFTLTVALLVPWAANAAEREVVFGEYLIEPAVAPMIGQGDVAASGAAPLSALGFEVSESLLGGSRVVVKPSFAAVSSLNVPEFVPYDETDSVCKELIRLGVARSCEQNQKLEIFATPDDPRFPELWGLSAAVGVDGPRAWDLSTGGTSVIVAVIDTGVDYTHPDLAANMWINPWEVPGNGIDDDANGVVDDIHGLNALTGSGNPMDDNSHGTHVAGTIGAHGNNARGVVGVNWNARIMALKFLGAGGSGSISGAVRAIDYMIAMKQRGQNIRVANNSWGGPGYSQTLHDAIERAAAADIIFVAAAGNEHNDNDQSSSYPAGYDVANVISVAAIDRNQNLASFSNYGIESVDIAAPGVEILSSVPGGYSSYSGTSMATPHVAGALALLLTAEPSLTSAQAIQRLYDTAVPRPTLEGLIRTARSLNVGRLLHNEALPLPAPTPPPPPCPYSISKQRAAVDRRADTGTVLVDGADEFNFKQVTLPFDFSFDGVRVRNVTVSPNGVLYFGAGPSSMDWQNGRQAPNRSLAALHSDLVSTIRVALTSESATFYWNSSLYTEPSAGYAETRVTLYADGSIREWIDFSSSRIERAIGAHATVGVTGRSSQSVRTYSYNDRKATDGLSLLYSPSCSSTPAPAPDESGVQIRRVKVWGVDNTGHVLDALVPGQRMRVRIRPAETSAAGLAQAAIRLDGQLCSEAPQFSVTPGQDVVLKGRLARKLSAYSLRELSISVAGVEGRKRIVNSVKNASKRRVLTRERFGSLCSAISRVLRVR